MPIHTRPGPMQAAVVLLAPCLVVAVAVFREQRRWSFEHVEPTTTKPRLLAAALTDSPEGPLTIHALAEAHSSLR